MNVTRAVPAFLLCAGLLCSGPHAAAADLDAVRADLLTMRNRADIPGESLRPEFLAARDGLGAWIERRLADLPQDGDTQAFARKLAAEIAAADLACEDAAPPGYNRCASPGTRDARGYVGLVEIADLEGFLVVQAEVGVACGFDETAYIYERGKTGWRRLFDTAQKPDAAGRYIAEQVQVVAFARTSKIPADSAVFVVAGAHPVCGGAFRPVHYRVWNARPGAGADLIVDGRELNAYTGRRDPPVSARFDGDDLVMEMDVGSMDPSRHSRVAVRRFAVDEKGARRVAPYALTPRDFVEEWLRAPWSTASAWTRADARAALEAIHARANERAAPARFSGATQRCDNTADTVQIGAAQTGTVQAGAVQAGTVQVGVRFASGEVFFRLKNDPAGAYEMLSADSAPQPSCAKPDATLDSTRSLF